MLGGRTFVLGGRTFVLGGRTFVLGGRTFVLGGRTFLLGDPRVLKMRRSSSSTVDPGNRARPEAISKNIQPTPQISMEVVYSVEPIRTSGGRYHNVTTSLEKVFEGTDFALANPKSANLSSPMSFMSKFCGFKSRCKTRRL